MSELKFFTQSSWITSETFYNHFEGTHYTRKVDYPYVSMTTDIFISENEDDDNPEIDFRIENKMWNDPTKDEDGHNNPISFGFSLTYKEAEYLQKHLKAFIKSNKMFIK